MQGTYSIATLDCKIPASAAVQAVAAAESAKVCKCTPAEERFKIYATTVDPRSDTRHQYLPYAGEKRGGTAFFRVAGAGRPQLAGDRILQENRNLAGQALDTAH